MAITHRLIVTSFVRVQGVLEISARYSIPITSVEHSLRVHLRRDTYIAPDQMTIDNKDQMTIAERYGEIEIL